VPLLIGRHICNYMLIVPLNSAPSTSLFCGKCGTGAHYRCDTVMGSSTNTATSSSSSPSNMTGCGRLLCKACLYWLHYELSESTISRCKYMHIFVPWIDLSRYQMIHHVVLYDGVSTVGVDGGLTGSNMTLLGAVGLATR
jgi:hypothetical protein